MSNSFKLKKNVSKESKTEKKEVTEPKQSVGFLKNKRERGTTTNGFSGKSSKDFSRKKT